MNTEITVLEGYYQGAYKNTLATIKHLTNQVVHLTPYMIITIDAVPVDNAMQLDYLAPDVALEEPNI